MSVIDNDKIVGTWTLGSYDIKMDSGEDINLWGKNTSGILIYLANGYMSVHVSNMDRVQFKDNDFLSGSFEELKSAFEGYTCYFGTYEYSPEEHVVYHRVMESVYPNWSGVTHTRYAELSDDKLILTTPPIKLSGQDGVMNLYWERV